VAGQTLREHLEFSRCLEKRAVEPGFTFREYLRKIKGAIEE
jgi:4-hydroxy-4-methyl-2-oxoglutarate aldolase